MACDLRRIVAVDVQVQRYIQRLGGNLVLSAGVNRTLGYGLATGVDQGDGMLLSGKSLRLSLPLTNVAAVQHN
jgi:hypothetical protein